MTTFCNYIPLSFWTCMVPKNLTENTSQKGITFESSDTSSETSGFVSTLDLK